MIVNNLNYLNKEEYEKFVEILEERRACHEKIKNIVISREYKDVELVNYIFNELNIERVISNEYEGRFDALYDILSDIPGDLDENIRFINLLIDDESFISQKMFKILKYTIEYFSEEIVSCGTDNDFPLSFDIYVQQLYKMKYRRLIWLKIKKYISVEKSMKKYNIKLIMKKFLIE